MTRRTLLGGGLAYAAAATAGTRGATPTEVADGFQTLPVAGEFHFDAKALDRAALDFGHVVHKRPTTVFRPTSVADIATVLRFAGREGLRVAARGQGHATYGRAMAAGGIVIDMSAMSTIHTIESDRVVVDAGTTWRAVLDAALSRGRTPPVLTNYLDLSVGGTLAVGGIGGATSRHGMQTDNVLEVNVVTGDGRELTCSADRNAALFNAVRGGLGQSAIITRAALRLVRAPERVFRVQLFYRDPHSLTAEQRLVLADGRFDQMQGAILPDGAGGWRYQLEGAVYHDGKAAPDQRAVLAGLSDDRSAAVMSDLTYLEDASAFARLEDALRSNGQWSNPHPWLLTFLRGSNAERVAADILQGLTNEDVGPFGRVTLYPMLTDALRTPLVRVPDENIVFPFNIIRIPASNDKAKAAQMVANNRALYDRVRGAGGLLYPVSAFPMRGTDWKDHFGPTWRALREAKERYDPNNALTPGYELFSSSRS